MRSLLDDVHFLGHLEDRVSSLSVARRHLLELAKAFAVSPRLLILDEPTAPLSQDSVELLFTAVRKLAREGTAVVYITHRLGEVREIADRVTVLRDGALRGTSAVKDISDADLLAMIIGRTLGRDLPAEARAVAGRGTAAARRRAERARLREHLAQRREGRDRGHRRRGRQRPAGAPARAGGSRAGDRIGQRRRQGALTARAARERGLHAGRPADRGLDGRPERARERGDDGARPADGGPDRQQAPRDRRRRARAVRAGGQGAVARSARLVALRRQPAEDHDGARDALRAGAARRRRADAGCRRRRARRDLPHPARGRRPRRAGRRRLERHQGARRAVRPRDRDVPRPGGRDARGRRGDRGADRPRRDQRDQAHRASRRPRTARSGRVAARAVHRRRLRAGRRPRGGDARPRRLRPAPTTAATSRTTTSTPSMFACAALGFISLGTDVRAAARRHRSLRRSARRLPRRPGVVLRPRRAIARRCGCSASS